MDIEANLRKQVLQAAQRLLRPVVAMLLRSGITWKEFSELSKNVFVNVATEDYGRRGRPTNVSRVAILTGMSRREVTKLRKANDGLAAVEGESRISYAARVLTGWHQDPDFLDEQGDPAPLGRAGDHPSLESLMSRYAGDIPNVAMYKELLGVKAIRENPDGTLQANSRYYMPAPLDANAVIRAGSVWRDLGETVNYNLARQGVGHARFEGRATNQTVRKKDLPALYELIEEKGQALLEETDQWLSDHESDSEGEGIRAGIGIYLIEDSGSLEK